MHLKSRTVYPPGEFQLLIPEVGMSKAITGGFREVVFAFAEIVRKNPAHAQRYNWPTDLRGQENFIDERECRRLVAQGWTTFVDMSNPNPPWVGVPAPEVKKNWRGVAAAVVGGGKAAYNAYSSLCGTGGKPASRELAETRAKVCLACPQNDVHGGLTAYFLEASASGIMALLGALKDLDVSTSVDDQLGVCKACSCPLRAKVFVNLDVITNNMPAEVWPKLQRNPLCWICREANRP